MSYVTTCITTDYKILRPFARNGILLKLQKMFISSLLAMIIPKVPQTRKNHKKSFSNGCENLQPSALHGIYGILL